MLPMAGRAAQKICAELTRAARGSAKLEAAKQYLANREAGKTQGEAAKEAGFSARKGWEIDNSQKWNPSKIANQANKPEPEDTGPSIAELEAQEVGVDQATVSRASDAKRYPSKMHQPEPEPEDTGPKHCPAGNLGGSWPWCA